MKRGTTAFISVSFLCVCVILFLAVVPAFAGAGDSRQKYYTDYCIEPGDSLWSIAQKYSSPEYADSSDYIAEVMSINHLTDSGIHEGAYLVLPYYED